MPGDLATGEADRRLVLSELASSRRAAPPAGLRQRNDRRVQGTKIAYTNKRQARNAFRQVEAEKAITDHDRTQKAFHKNRERLRAERLAREAAELLKVKK